MTEIHRSGNSYSDQPSEGSDRVVNAWGKLVTLESQSAALQADIDALNDRADRRKEAADEQLKQNEAECEALERSSDQSVEQLKQAQEQAYRDWKAAQEASIEANLDFEQTLRNHQAALQLVDSSLDAGWYLVNIVGLKFGTLGAIGSFIGGKWIDWSRPTDATVASPDALSGTLATTGDWAGVTAISLGFLDVVPGIQKGADLVYNLLGVAGTEANLVATVLGKERLLEILSSPEIKVSLSSVLFGGDPWDAAQQKLREAAGAELDKLKASLESSLAKDKAELEAKRNYDEKKKAVNRALRDGGQSVGACVRRAKGEALGAHAEIDASQRTETERFENHYFGSK